VTPPHPARGEIWVVDLNPTRGHEQAGTRPSLVISANVFNRGSAGLVTVIPITTRRKKIRSHIELHPPEGGLREMSFVKTEDLLDLT